MKHSIQELFSLIKHGDLNSLHTFLLASDVDINCRNSLGYTPLVMAIRSANTMVSVDHLIRGVY